MLGIRFLASLKFFFRLSISYPTSLGGGSGWGEGWGVRCNDLDVFLKIMLAGVLIAAKKLEKNIGENIFDLSPAVFCGNGF